jgi:hypothetical protein
MQTEKTGETDPFTCPVVETEPGAAGFSLHGCSKEPAPRFRRGAPAQGGKSVSSGKPKIENSFEQVTDCLKKKKKKISDFLLSGRKVVSCRESAHGGLCN